MAGPRETKLHAFSPPETAVPVRAVGDEPPARRVAEVVASVNQLLAHDASLASVWVRGEISGYRPYSSGHWYFALKDESALLNAVMFKGANARVRFQPEEGMEVLARGRVQVYPERSSLQIIVEELRPVGVGELALRFEQLRRRLEAEGLFAQARKRPIPQHPRVVGIVTSLQAAALRDMVRVATARHPGVRLLVAPARVQGEGAAEEIAAALARLDRTGACDVIIVGRGGGSVEDLWAFNEEPVVRAVVACATPVVSAVGHETDFTLCDFAADLRAATPSNACELVVPDAEALLEALDDAQARMEASLERLVPELQQKLDGLGERAEDAVWRAVEKERELMAAHAGRLEALSPLAVLGRGYTVTRKRGRVVRAPRDVAPGDDIEIITRDGAIDAKVTGRRDDAQDAG